jgi:hypothetical protein
MILQHLAGIIQDFKEIFETIEKVQQHTKGQQEAPCADGRREKEVHLTSTESTKGDFKSICQYCKKKAGQKHNLARSTQLDKVVLDLDLERNDRVWKDRHMLQEKVP